MSMADLVHSLCNIEVPKRPRKIKRSWVWTPPAAGFINMNVDEFFLGSSSREGIGEGGSLGTLRVLP